MSKYLDAVRLAPTLVHHLAHLVTPGAIAPSGRVTPGELTRAPLRLAPLDAIDDVMLELANWEGFWREEFQHYGFVETPVLRTTVQGYGIGYRRGVVRDPEQLLEDAQALAGRLVLWWEDISVHPQFDAFCESLDDALIRTIKQWPLEMRDPVPQRPRECEVCGVRDVWAGADQYGDSAALCARCGAVFHLPPQWLPIAEAAKQLGRHRSQIHRWIEEGGVEVQVIRGRRHVELRECGQWLQFKAARRLANLPRVAIVERGGELVVTFAKRNSRVVG